MWAFGSRVTGTVVRTSDLDLAVVCASALPVLVLASLRNDLAESAVSIRVDVIDWHRTQPPFLEIIERQKTLFKAAGEKFSRIAFFSLFDAPAPACTANAAHRIAFL